MTDNNAIRYTDSKDRRYGIAGMVVGIFAFDGQQYIDSVDMQSTDLEVIKMTPDFLMVSSPSVSPKTVWHTMATRYRLMVAMTMGNIVSRSLSGHNSTLMSPQTLHYIISRLAEQADDLLGLDDEENRQLCLDTYNRLRRAFQHPAIQPLVNSMVDRMSHDPMTISRSELFELFGIND